MTLKRDRKFEENLICCFKNDKNLSNFDLSTRNSQNFYSDWLLLCKIDNFDAKFEDKLTGGLEKDKRNLANFYQSTRKSKKWNFDEILLSKVENALA